MKTRHGIPSFRNLERIDKRILKRLTRYFAGKESLQRGDFVVRLGRKVFRGKISLTREKMR